MICQPSVFDKTLADYLAQLRNMDLHGVARKLGGTITEDGLKISLLGRRYCISQNGIIDIDHRQPPFAVCIILCKYILLSPEYLPTDATWTAYRDLQDSGPLLDYFTAEVEGALANHFSGSLSALQTASHALDGKPVLNLETKYDLNMKFAVLPHVPIVILFNDQDEEFPTQCTFLFEKRAEHFLDAECLAMLGRHLFTCLQANS